MDVESGFESRNEVVYRRSAADRPANIEQRLVEFAESKSIFRRDPHPLIHPDVRNKFLPGIGLPEMVRVLNDETLLVTESSLLRIQPSCRPQDHREVRGAKHLTLFSMGGLLDFSYPQDSTNPLRLTLDFLVRVVDLAADRLRVTIPDADVRSQLSRGVSSGFDLDKLRLILSDYGIQDRHVFEVGKQDGSWPFKLMRNPTTGAVQPRIGKAEGFRSFGVAGPKIEIFAPIGEVPDGLNPSIDGERFLELSNTVFVCQRSSTDGFEDGGAVEQTMFAEVAFGLERVEMAKFEIRSIFETTHLRSLLDKLARFASVDAGSPILGCADTVRSLAMLLHEGQINPMDDGQQRICAELASFACDQARVSVGESLNSPLRLVENIAEVVCDTPECTFHSRISNETQDRLVELLGNRMMRAPPRVGRIPANELSLSSPNNANHEPGFLRSIARRLFPVNVDEPEFASLRGRRATGTPERVTQFAPSPTGEPHLGTLFAAIVTAIQAKRLNGKLVFRIDDTDARRNEDGSAIEFHKMLELCGIQVHESKWRPGAY
ncbi:MAG: glutamate--tRNA ligase family protein, partial [Planctomycetota bacterium]